MKTVLVTGISSGIGASVKDYFIERGIKVVGIDISPTTKNHDLIDFIADIRDYEKLVEIKKTLIEKNINLDAIINIAGIHEMVSFIESDYNKFKKVIDINLLGPMAVNRAFYSLLNKKGRIIIISSEVASFDALPFNGLYSVSKVALETYAQSLRQELNLLGQKVISVLPGAIETPLSSGSINSTMALADNTKLFKNESTKFVTITKKFMGKPLKPIKLARLIYRITCKKKTKLTYKIHHNIGLVMLNLLPKRLQCFVIKKILK